MENSLLFILKSAGVFAYPLAICSFLATFVVVERLLALSNQKTIPEKLLDSLLKGSYNTTENSLTKTAGGRILQFFNQEKISPESLKAYAQLELTKLERGFFILEIVISAAPLIGLLGTVTGLVDLFFNLSSNASAHTEKFIEGISLALTTTILGLTLAIPTIVAHGYLLRRVDLIQAQITVLVERLSALLQDKPSL